MLKQSLDYLKTDCDEIRSMGGASASPLWCQIKADMTGKRLITLKSSETACLGSAILSGVATGVFESIEKASDMAVKFKDIYEPSGTSYEECYKNYIELDEKLF